MASPEPRLPAGDGLPEVRVPIAPPVFRAGAREGYEASMPLPTPAVVTAGSIAPTSVPPPSDRPSRRRDTLPPLISLSDLVLEAPPWLFSAVLHMIAVIVLGLLIIAQDRPDEILLRFDYTNSDGEELAGDELDISLDLGAPEIASELVPQQLPEITDALVIEPTDVDLAVVTRRDVEIDAPIRLALTGREKGMQQGLLDAYGGTRATQRAVLDALRWLARNQGKQGLWSMRGRYADGVSAENVEAATALALIAFQGAGYTPAGDPMEPYTKLTRRAWNSLLKKQDDDGNFFHTGRGHAQLYTQALSTIALCELYGMTEDSRYREPAQRAIDYCVKVQAPEGGWRYFPGSGSDLSVTGWFVMALQSARMAGLEVPSSTLDRVRNFLDSVGREGGSYYAYQPGRGASRSMTAEGLLCRQYLGWSQTDPRLRDGASYLARNVPVWEDDERDVYYWYYATQVCHHMEGTYWRKWNEAMRMVLPENQVQTGKEKGSWDPRGDEWGSEGGRLFVTCLSTYMLEVYYRHLPIYQLEMLGGGL